MAALEGELTFGTVPALLARADELAGQPSLDLAAVARVDSAGLAFLLELTRRARRRGSQLRFAGMQPQIRELIRFFDLESALNLDGAA